MSTGDLAVRPATVADRAVVLRLLTGSLRERGIAEPADAAERTIELALASGSLSWLLLATRGGMAVGVLLGSPVLSPEHGGAVMRVETICSTSKDTLPTVGKALLEHVVGESRGYGLSAVIVEAPDGDGSAARVCEALGGARSATVSFAIRL